MRRVIVFALVAAGVACAQGGSTDTSNSPVTTDSADGGDAASLHAPDGDQDADGDGYPASVDCDDHDPNVHPGATEICNGIDDNCDGRIDEGFDLDNDGYPTCDTPSKKADCNDADPTIHPGATETCNNKDDNCDGVIDEGFDVDKDGYYLCVHGTKAIDCNDNDPTVYPGAPELCDGKDNDCNGIIDDAPALLKGSLAAPQDAHWKLAGVASYAFTNWVILAPAGQQNVAGALWWNASYTFDTFDVTATIWLDNAAGGADGLAFAWVPGATVTNTGNVAEGYGFVGLGGYGAVIDDLQNPGEPAAPFLAIVDGTTGTHLARAAIPNVRDEKNHTYRVKVDAGAVSVFIDGTNYINNFALPGYVAFSGHWGFTAATGNASAYHEVQAITMSFPKGQGCVP
jgi:hypothetical protein